jgi:ketosteroid isomerase-like protein
MRPRPGEVDGCQTASRASRAAIIGHRQVPSSPPRRPCVFGLPPELLGDLMDIKDLAADLDRQEAQAMQQRDLVALTALYSDRLLVTPPGGPVADKATVLRLVETGVLAYAEVRRNAEHVLDCGGLLVVMGSEEVIAAGHPLQARRYTHVWTDEAGIWRLLARHAGPVMSAPS